MRLNGIKYHEVSEMHKRAVDNKIATVFSFIMSFRE